MRVWVTGAGGFVGRHLVPRLARDGCDVTATDRDLDVTNAAAVEAAFTRLRPDAVVHLAAQSSVAASWREPELTYRVNFLGARSILDGVARACPAARVVLVGSAAAYGALPAGAPPFREDAPLRPASPYARAKVAADLLGAQRASSGQDVVRVRAFNHAGPGQADHFALSSFARQLAEIEIGRREPRLRVGNLDAVRDFLDVEDVVDAYAALLRGAPADAYNVASGRGRRIGELLDELVALSRARPAIEADPERVRPTDAAVGDATRLRRATGWTPRVPLEATLAGLLDFWRGEVSAS